MLRVLSILVMMCLLIGGFGGGQNLQSASAQGNCAPSTIFRVAIPGGAPNTFNPMNIHGSVASIASKLQDGGLNPVPTLTGGLDWGESVTDWVHSANNYTTWTFNIAPGKKWSNGQPITPQDIINTFSPGFALNSSYDFQNLASEIKSATPLNTSAVQYVLNRPDAQFEWEMSDILYSAVMSPSFVAGGPANNFGNGTMVANGMFYASNYTVGQTQVAYYRNPYFTPASKICELVLYTPETASTAETLLTSGTVDAVVSFDPGAVSSLSSNPSLHVSAAPDLAEFAIDYNVTVYPYNMTAFRQALVYGINQNQIQSQAFFGYGQTAYNAEGGTPSQGNYLYNPSQQNYAYNQTKALSLLSSIGIKKGSDGFLHYSNGTVVTLTTWVNTDQPVWLVAGNLAISNLESLGFKINEFTASTHTIIGNDYANVDNIQHAMIIYGGTGFESALPLDDAGQACDYAPIACNVVWEAPTSAQSMYQSNYSAFLSTQDPTLVHKYLDNIQTINAQYLPQIVLNYFDVVTAYSTQRWTNWPTSGHYITNYGVDLNETVLAQLVPVSSVSSTATSSGASTVSSGTSASTSTTSNNTSSTALPLSYLAVVAVVALVSGSLVVLSTRRKSSFLTKSNR